MAFRDLPNHSAQTISHAIFTPGQPGWMEALERALVDLEPDAVPDRPIERVVPDVPPRIASIDSPDPEPAPAELPQGLPEPAESAAYASALVSIQERLRGAAAASSPAERADAIGLDAAETRSRLHALAM